MLTRKCRIYRKSETFAHSFKVIWHRGIVSAYKMYNYSRATKMNNFVTSRMTVAMATLGIAQIRNATRLVCLSVSRLARKRLERSQRNLVRVCTLRLASASCGKSALRFPVPGKSGKTRFSGDSACFGRHFLRPGNEFLKKPTRDFAQ